MYEISVNFIAILAYLWQLVAYFINLIAKVCHCFEFGKQNDKKTIKKATKR